MVQVSRKESHLLQKELEQSFKNSTEYETISCPDDAPNYLRISQAEKTPQAQMYIDLIEATTSYDYCDILP